MTTGGQSPSAGGAPGGSGGGAPAWLFAIAAAGSLVVVAQPFAVAWNLSADLGHGWALPWLTGWLLWERRGELARGAGWRAGPAVWAGLAAGLVVVLALRLLLEPFPMLPTYLWALGAGMTLGGTVAAGLIGGSGAARAAVFPLALVLTGLPLPGLLENSVVLPLRHVLAGVVAETMNLLGTPALADGTIIRIPEGTVGVDEACGGMRSLQSSVMIALFAGEAFRLTWRRRGALLGLAIGAAVGGNLARAFVLTWAANSGGEEKLAAWHDPVGYLALVFALAATGVAGWCWRKPGVLSEAGPEWPAGRRVARGTAGWGVAALAGAVAIQVGTTAWFAVDVGEDARIAPGFELRWPTQAARFKEEPLGPSGEDLLRPDIYRAASWEAGRDKGRRAAYFIEWNEGQKARVLPSLHSPDVCLPNLGAELVGAFEAPALVLQGRELPFEAYEFKSIDGVLMHVFRLAWDVDQARAFAPAPDYKSGWEVQRDRWREVAERRLRARVQVAAFAVIGVRTREEAVAAYRDELGGMLAFEVERH